MNASNPKPADPTSARARAADVLGDVTRDVEFAARAARSAGERALALRSSGKWSGDMLADIGDQAADGFLQGLVRGRYPEDGILSEETADTRERLEHARTWIVDPLDGTREFSQLRDDWGVHVALTIDGKPVLGAVALPAQGFVLRGVCIEGMERAELEGDGELVPGSSASHAPPRIAVSRSHTPSAWIQRVAERAGATMVPAGSAGNKVCMLLLGRADIYMHRTGLKEWDTCAPEAVARALGWCVMRLGGDEHRYNQPDPRNNDLVVCRPEWRERLIEWLAASGALQR